MEFSKEDLRRAFNEVMSEVEKNRRIDIRDIRKLCSNGIPAIDILMENIPIACFKEGFNKWLKSL